MRTKISDFKLAEFLIKRLCDHKGCPFVDAGLSFDNESQSNGSWSIGRSKNIGHTIYKIVQHYVNNVCTQDGRHLFDDETQKQDFLIATAAFLRHLAYGSSSFDEGQHDGFNALRLYQEPLVWILVRDLICPIYHKKFVNYQIIAGSSPFIDIGMFCKKGSFDGKDPEQSFIFTNMGVQNQAIRSVFLLLAAIESLQLSPDKLVRDVFESEISEKFVGMVKLAFENDQDVENFIMTLLGLVGLYSDDFPDLKLGNNIESGLKQIKEAQYFNNPAMWWYFGVLEKLLEPARGADWGTRQSLNPFIEEFWDKVEHFRQKKVHKADGVPFNTLLEIKSEDHKTDATKTLQSLLGSERIW